MAHWQSGSTFFAHAVDFGVQPTPSRDLPDPTPLIQNISIGVLEVLAGARSAEQLSRWLSEDAYRKLVTRANLSARARSARGVGPSRPVHTIVRVQQSEPADGIVEAVTIVRGPIRTRALTMRLEGMDRRWRVTSLALL